MKRQEKDLPLICHIMTHVFYEKSKSYISGIHLRMSRKHDVCEFVFIKLIHSHINL